MLGRGVARNASIGASARWNDLATSSLIVDRQNGLHIAFAADDSLGQGMVYLSAPSAPTVVTPHGPGNAVTTYQWDDILDVPISIQAPSGVLSTRQYDRTTRTLTWAQTGGDTTRFTYNSVRLPTTTLRVANGASDGFGYNGLGNVISHTAPLTGTTTIARDALGRVTLVDSPVAGAIRDTTLTFYDSFGRDTLQTTTGQGDVLKIQKRYDAVGNVQSITQTPSRDPNNIGPVSHTFGYDYADRQVFDSLSGAPSGVRFTYDQAGNLVAGGRTLFGRTTTYDALNRPTASNGGYSSSTFTYDAFGRLAHANNPFARVARGYDLAGALIADTLAIATGAAQPNTDNDFSKHQYVFSYTYDPSGRRLTMTQPAALGGGTTSYTYDDPRTGALAAVVDPDGIKYRHHYDVMGRFDSLVRRSGLADSLAQSWSFDLASRVTGRRAMIGATTMLSDGLAYDFRNRVTRANGSDTVAYAPLGHATYSRISSLSETMTIDVLGNRVKKVGVLPHGAGAYDLYTYQHGTGRLRLIDRSSGTVGDTTFYGTDWLGNTVTQDHVMWTLEGSGGPAVYRQDDGSQGWWVTPLTIGGIQTSLPAGTLRRQSNSTTMQYDDDNHLIRTAFWIDSLYGTPTLPQGLSVRYNASEEYRHDALGRQIWVRVLRDTTCQYAQKSTGCRSSVMRVLWDGDQIGGEIRTAATAPQYLSEELDTDYGVQAGVVSYTHGGDIDHPLALRKLSWPSILPLTDWQGQIGSGVCWSPTQAAARCASSSVVFPLRSAGIFGAAMGAGSSTGLPSWYGSLIEGSRSGTGKVYQRNRYLDPETGRFTQEDPIGLAGGLNLYGFAGGDPVNFSDPFGLCGVANNAGDDDGNDSTKAKTKKPSKVSCEYTQSTGAMSCTDDVGGSFSEKGYSGISIFKNWPAAESYQDHGPIPAGTYKLGKALPGNYKGKGPVVMRLTPDDGNEMFSRGGFLVHGDNGKGMASQGCIIMSRATRDKMSVGGTVVVKP